MSWTGEDEDFQWGDLPQDAVSETIEKRLRGKDVQEVPKYKREKLLKKLKYSPTLRRKVDKIYSDELGRWAIGQEYLNLLRVGLLLPGGSTSPGR